jgi:hypothetical protein
MTKWIVPALFVGWSSSLSAQEPGHFRFEILSPDSSSVVAHGEFMVSAERLVGMEVDPDHHRGLSGGDPRLIRRATAEGNVCFGVREAPPEFEGREFYPGIIDAGIADFEAFRTEGDEPGFYIYMSPDASARLVGTFAADSAFGWVHQRDWDRGGPLVWMPFRANRIGDASEETCRMILDIQTSGRDQAL